MRHKTYKLNKTPPSREPWLFTLFTVLVLVGVGLIVYHRTKQQHPKSVIETKLATVVSYANVSGKYLFSGTIMLGRAVETYAKGDYNQPFSGMATLGTYDAHIGVLECPITSNADSYANEVNNLIFNCQPGWIPTLKKYFPILNLSSDHMNDQGPDGIVSTFRLLQAAGVQTVGNYNPHTDTDDCKAVVLPLHLNKTDGQSTEATLPIAICSYNYKIIFSPAPGELESIQKWSKIMPVIGLMNGGPEYQHQAGPDQVNVAHKMIDYGASFVVGNGTHWVQNTEVYKGKLIVYSMGNFIFDQLDYDGRIALNLSVGMNLRYTDTVGKWLKIGDNCQNDTIQCLDLANSQNLQKIYPTFSFDAIGSYGGYQQVATKANTQQQKDIEQRANWPQTQQQLANNNH